MSISLTGPGDRYSVVIDALVACGDESFTRYTATTAYPDDWGSCRVVLGDKLSLRLGLGENGITLHAIRLLGADRALVTAAVTALGGAPDWLPSDSRYLLFDGGREEAEGLQGRFIPLEGIAGGQQYAAAESTTLDRLAVAIGRSVARANAALARTQAEAGVALVSTVTVRVAVTQTDLGHGRVQVVLARSGSEENANQFVELTMTTVPGADKHDEEEGAAAPSSIGDSDVITIRSRSNPGGGGARR